MQDKKIVISIISHGHGEKLEGLLDSIQAINSKYQIQCIITFNIKEEIRIRPEAYDFPIQVIHNQECLGFAHNQNQAFKAAEGDVFCVCNPDIYFKEDPFPELLAALDKDDSAVSAPKILTHSGKLQYSFRKVITPLTLFRKYILKKMDYSFPEGKTVFYPDWVAGIFLCIKSQVFKSLNGFDENYFLYCEDSDFCCRARAAGYKIAYLPNVTIYHYYQGDSHRKPRYFLWHVQSLVKFFSKKY